MIGGWRNAKGSRLWTQWITWLTVEQRRLSVHKWKQTHTAMVSWHDIVLKPTIIHNAIVSKNTAVLKPRHIRVTRQQEYGKQTIPESNQVEPIRWTEYHAVYLLNCISHLLGLAWLPLMSCIKRKLGNESQVLIWNKLRLRQSKDWSYKQWQQLVYLKKPDTWPIRNNATQ